MSEFEKVMARLAQDGFEKEQSIIITWKSDENGDTEVSCCLNCKIGDAVQVIQNLISQNGDVGKIIERATLLGLSQEIEKRFAK